MSERKVIYPTTFISRFHLNSNEIYSKERYLTLIMRNSIFERILTKYILQGESKNFDLFPFLDNIKKNEEEYKTQFLKIFEKQSLTTKIKNDSDNEYDIASNHNLFLLKNYIIFIVINLEEKKFFSSWKYSLLFNN